MNVASRTGVDAWHAYMDASFAERAPNVALLDALIAEDAVFHSPVVHSPQAGRAKVISYLAAAAHVFSDTGFTYVREMVDGQHALLEFTATLDGIFVNGIDLISFNDKSQITDFKVMVRPLKAVNMLWEKMAAKLAVPQG